MKICNKCKTQNKHVFVSDWQSQNSLHSVTNEKINFLSYAKLNDQWQKHHLQQSLKWDWALYEFSSAAITSQKKFTNHFSAKQWDN